MYSSVVKCSGDDIDEDKDGDDDDGDDDDDDAITIQTSANTANSNYSTRIKCEDKGLHFPHLQVTKASKRLRV